LHGRSEQDSFRLQQILHGAGPADFQTIANGGMAVDAARIEPVSSSKFPASREKNREFYRIRASRDDFRAQSASEFSGLQQNSLRNGAGNFLKNGLHPRGTEGSGDTEFANLPMLDGLGRKAMSTYRISTTEHEVARKVIRIWVAK